MRKEVVLAIVIGLSLGLIIIFGVYTANQATQNQTGRFSTPTPNLTQSPTPQPASRLTLVSPQDGDVFTTDIATVSGQTQAGSQLIILTESEDLVVPLEENGYFAQTIKLAKGANFVQVISVNPEGNQETIKLNLVYTTALDD